MDAWNDIMSMTSYGLAMQSKQALKHRSARQANPYLLKIPLNKILLLPTYALKPLYGSNVEKQERCVFVCNIFDLDTLLLFLLSFIHLDMVILADLMLMCHHANKVISSSSHAVETNEMSVYVPHSF